VYDGERAAFGPPFCLPVVDSVVAWSHLIQSQGCERPAVRRHYSFGSALNGVAANPMRQKELVLIAIGVVCAVVFAWSLTITCSTPTIAHAANWLPTVAFAFLGPMWASQAPSSARMIAGFSTVVVGFLAALVAPAFEFACH
jgi:hypothetical protein